MSTKQIETDNVNGFRFAEQGPLFSRCSRRRNIGHHHVNLVINDQRKWSCQENKIITGCYLLSDTKVRGYIKCMLNFGLKAVCFGYQNKD